MEFENAKSFKQLLLNQAYLQGLTQNEEKTKTWTQYRDRHKKLIEELNTLRKELTVNCMVPLGKRALMRGKLVHTNEILVCIGDGYFVKYTVEQAIALCNRRIKHSEEMLNYLEKERNLFELKQIIPQDYDAFGSEETIDLEEEWDEKRLQDWRVEHRKKEREYRQRLMNLKKSQSELPNIRTEEDLFKRLDELELQEELEDEYSRFKEERRDFYGDNLLEGEVYEESEDSDESEDADEADNKKCGNSRSELENIDKIICENEKEETNPEIVSNENVQEFLETDTKLKVLREIEGINYKIVEEVKVNQTDGTDLNNDIVKLEKKSDKLETEVTFEPIVPKKSNMMNSSKINGKFEVSIIKEEEIQRTLSQTEINTTVKPPVIHKSPLFRQQKSKKHSKRTYLEETLEEICNNEFHKAKGSGRRVSFAEPHFVELESSSDNDDVIDTCGKDFSLSNKKQTDSDEDDVIKISFKHTNKSNDMPEGTDNEVNSPRDIYRIFCKPKSILKRSINDLYVYDDKISTVQECDYEDENSGNEVTAGASAYNAVVKDIQERIPESQTLEIRDISEPAKKIRPVSRFRLERATLKK